MGEGGTLNGFHVCAYVLCVKTLHQTWHALETYPRSSKHIWYTAYKQQCDCICARYTQLAFCRARSPFSEEVRWDHNYCLQLSHEFPQQERKFFTLAQTCHERGTATVCVWIELNCICFLFKFWPLLVINFHLLPLHFSPYGSHWDTSTAWLPTYFKIYSFVFSRRKRFIQVWKTNKQKKNPNKLNPLKFKKVSTYYLLYSFVIVTKVSGVFYRLLLQQLEIHPF